MQLSAIAINELCLGLICTFNLGIGTLVLAKQPSRLVNRVFALVAFSVAFWGLGLILISQTHNFAWNTMILDGFVAILYSLMLFAKVFPDAKRIHWKFCFYTVLAPATILVLAPMKLIIKAGVFRTGTNPEPVNGPLYPLFLIISAVYVGGSVYMFVRTYRQSRGREREQMRYFLFGLSVFAICAFLFDILLPSIGIFQLNFLGAISSIILTGVTAYAILRHELLDIRIIIQRGLIYTVLLAIIVFTYFAGLELAGYLLHNLTQINAIIAGGITTTIGIFFIPPLTNYFRKATDHVFFKDSYDYAQALHVLSNILYTSLNKEDILSRSETVLKEIFKTEQVAFILDPKAISETSSIDQAAGFETLSAPIIFAENAIGVLRLGNKRSGDSYTKQDAQLISTFVFQAAIALGKAELHEQVQTYSTHLEQLVEMRTREIKKLQEEQRQNMIDISHNLQTPLAIIRGEVELLGESTLEQERMRAVRKSLDRVSGFIRQLLHLSRLEHSLYTVELAPLDLGKMIKEQAEYFEVIAEDKGARIVTQLEKNIWIIGNKRLLEELFTNLVANALGYCKKDELCIVEITLRKTESEAVVTIRDNGIGISENDMKNIFTRFYRAAPATLARSGTGLGLAIAKRIVENHKGSIEVTSTLGKGTEFSVTFPWYKDSPE